MLTFCDGLNYHIFVCNRYVLKHHIKIKVDDLKNTVLSNPELAMSVSVKLVKHIVDKKETFWKLLRNK